MTVDAMIADLSPASVLIFMTDRHIGNVVVSLPALQALQNKYQDVPHLFVIAEGFEELLERVIDPAHTLVYPRSKIKHGNPWQRARAYFGFLRKLKSLRADLAIDLVGSRNSGVLCKASAAPRRLAADRAKRPALYTDWVTLNDDSHKVYDYTDIAAAAGAEIDERPFQFDPDPKKVARIQAKLDEAGIDQNRPLISVHIGAGRIQKLWNIESFVEVIDWLGAQGCQVVLLGAAAEENRAEAVISRLEYPVLNLLGRISLGEVFALLKLSAAYLGNDSGPMHMAAAMGTPGVAMFSYARETEWGPRSHDFQVLRGQDICTVCIKKKCRDPVCITDLDTPPVIDALAAIPGLSIRSNPVSRR